MIIYWLYVNQCRILFQHNSTYPILKILHTKKKTVQKRSFKRYPYQLSPSKWECCTWNPAFWNTPKVVHLLQVFPWDLWTSGSTSFSNIPASLTRRFGSVGQAGDFLFKGVVGPVTINLALKCVSMRDARWNVVLNPQRCLLSCLQLKELLSFVPRIRVQQATFGRNTPRWRVSLWKSRLAKVVFFATIIYQFHHVPCHFGSVPEIWNISAFVFAPCLILLAPRLEFFLKVPSFKRNWFEATAYRSRIFSKHFQSNLGCFMDHF